MKQDRPAALARPYLWTGGRTASSVRLAVEAVVHTTATGKTLPYQPIDVGSVVVHLCRRPRSIAEIAARLGLPLGVARVLVGDLVDAGLLTAQTTLTDHTDPVQHRELLERVLDGLHAR